MEKNISGVILAGGENKRFDGLFKPEIVIEGRTILSRISDVIEEIFDELIIVINDPLKFNESRSFKTTGDIFIKAGPLGGLHAALKKSTREAVFAFAGDMPFLDKKLILEMIEIFNAERCQVLVPKVDDHAEPLHAIYHRSVLKDIEKYLSGNNDFAVWKFLNRIDVRYLMLSGSSDIKKAFTNINSSDQLKDLT